MVVVTGGSSVGTLDLTGEVLQTFPGTEILGHGVSIRPGKPTLLADINGKPFLGLPGHPVSAMVIFHFFGKPILRILSGLSREVVWHQIKIKAKASRNIPSVPGREDYVRMKLEEKDGTFWAHPIFGKSGAISNLVRANGLIRIGINEEGLEEGEEAEVISSEISISNCEFQIFEKLCRHETKHLPQEKNVRRGQKSLFRDR